MKQDMGMDRLQQIYMAAEKLMLSKTQAEVLVGGRRRLERLVSQGKIDAVKTGKNQFSRWECNAADVLRYVK